MNKVNITEWHDDIRWDIDDKPVVDVIAILQQIIDKHGTNAALNISGDDVEITVVVRRLETDEEYAERLDRHARMHYQQEQRDRAEYERLKAKFGE